MKKPLFCAEWTTVIPPCKVRVTSSPKFDLKSVQCQFKLINFDDYDLILEVEGCETREGCECSRCFLRIPDCVRCTVVVSQFHLELPPLPVRRRTNLSDSLCTIDFSHIDKEEILGKTISLIVLLEEDGGSTQEEEEEGADWYWYRNPQRLHSLPRDFARLLDDPRTADIRLLCGDLTIPAHKTVLSARSEVFEKMLLHHQTESITGSVEIPDIEPRIVKEFLRYLYTGALPDEMTVEKASRLFEAGDKYNVRCLVEECGCYLHPDWRYSRIASAGVLEPVDIDSDGDFDYSQDGEDEIINRYNSFKSLRRDFAKLLYDPPTASDIKLLCGGVSIPAHKAILSARSEVFEKMLQTDMLERRTGSIEIPDIEPQTIKEFLRYVYSSKLPDELTVEKALRLYEAGDKYDVRPLVAECGRYLGSSLARDNACDVLVLADIHSNSHLKNQALTFLSLAEVPLRPGIWREFSDEYPKLAHETVEFANELLKYKTSLNPVTQNRSCTVRVRRYRCTLK